MVKGVSKRVIVVDSPDPTLFEQAIFIIRDGAFSSRNQTQNDVVREAQRIAGMYMKNNVKRRRIRLPAPLYILIGSALTGIAWLIAGLIA
ncbi:MAG: translation initiation factor 2 [Clostridiales bacterium]|nr:translation initiation factor 2 [Clostridiales bacterium]